VNDAYPIQRELWLPQGYEETSRSFERERATQRRRERQLDPGRRPKRVLRAHLSGAQSGPREPTCFEPAADEGRPGEQATRGKLEAEPGKLAASGPAIDDLVAW